LKDEAIAALTRPDPERLEQDLAWLAEPANHLLTWHDERYPALLRDIPSSPAALFLKGDPDSLWQPQLAVIGSRNPTAGGRENARDFAAELGRQGLTITSGMADGIDSEAHRAALDAGGLTVAVLGTGPDMVYPASGRRLAERIAAQGALVTEFPPGTAAKREHFPSRNRIISGLSLGVLVIEAGLRSGTLITARLAGDQGREIFALPGSIHNPMAKGCHRLIREGARLVESVSEILEEVASMAGRLAVDLERSVGESRLDPAAARPKLVSDASDEPPWATDPEYRRLWECLGHDPRPVDAIIEESGLTAKSVSAMLLLLELRGMVEAHAGGAYSRKNKRP
jgi:DNA processing protein